MSRCSRGSADTAGPKRRRGLSQRTVKMLVMSVRKQDPTHRNVHTIAPLLVLCSITPPHTASSHCKHYCHPLPPTATHCHPLLHIGCHPRLTPIPPSRSAAASGSCCRKSARRGRRKAPETRRRPSRPRPRPHPPRPRLLRTQGRYHLLLPPPPPPLLQAHSRGAHRKIRV